MMTETEPAFGATRLKGLDALRGIAALSVTLFHYTGDLARTPAHRDAMVMRFSIGNYGVDLFFMISGFVILMTLENTPSIARFAISRIGRLYPAFWFALALCVGIAALTGEDVSWITPGMVALNATMIGQVFQAPMIFGPWWSLGCEVLFYLIAPLLLVAGGRQVERLCIGWMILAGAYLYFAGPLPSLTLMPYAYLFSIGILAYRAHTGRATQALIPAIGFCLLSAWVIDNHPNHVLARYGNLAFTTFLALLFWAGVKGWFPRRAMPVLLFLGEISYSLYLIHAELGVSVIYTLERHGIEPNCAVLIALVAAIMIAWLMRRYIEIPGQMIIKNGWKAATRS